MLSSTEFAKKQTVIVHCSDGEKISFRNDNLVIKRKDGSIKHQSTCWRIAMLMLVGSTTVSSGLIERSHKFGFPIFLMKPSLRTYETIGFSLEGNTRLRRLQYSYEGIEIAQLIVCNKIRNQRKTLMRQRYRGDSANEAISSLLRMENKARDATALRELLGVEGSAARVYFGQHFNNCEWVSRVPRAKRDYVNAALDYGYSLLFNYIEALLRYFGFDLYVGVLHREFYQRKSLVCDLVEPFRPVVDICIRNAISRRQCKEEDFEIRNGSYFLKDWNQVKRYNGLLMESVLEYKDDAFRYVRDYYRCFVKRAQFEDYPSFEMD